MRLAWQRWQAWCVCWGKKELVPCRTVPLTHAHTDTHSRVWWRRTERRQTGNWCNKRTRRRQERKLCPCVLCKYGWMDNFYVDRDFINFSAIKAPPGSTTEVLFDWQSKRRWSELQVTLKLSHCSPNVHFFFLHCFIFFHSYCLGVSLRLSIVPVAHCA